MGLTVEKAIVIGIFVVIVAILGIAISGAMGSDGSLFGTPQHVAATSDSDEAGGERKLLLRDADITKLAEASVRQQEMARRRDEAVRRMTGEPGPVVKAPAPIPAPSPGAPTERDKGTALKRNAEPVAEPAEAAEAAEPDGTPAVEPAYVEYAVVQGDTLWKIARHQYGDGDIKRIVDVILAANPEVDGDDIKAGETVLKLPVDLPDDVQTPPVLKKSASAAKNGEPANSTTDSPKYEVVAGDSLRRIARRELGDESRWEEIYELNRKYLSAPEKVYPGMTLLMPE